MSARCHVCEGRFGLIRYRSGTRQFCSRKCLASDRERLVRIMLGEKENKDRRRMFLGWLKASANGAT